MKPVVVNGAIMFRNFVDYAALFKEGSTVGELLAGVA